MKNKKYIKYLLIGLSLYVLYPIPMYYVGVLLYKMSDAGDYCMDEIYKPSMFLLNHAMIERWYHQKKGYCLMLSSFSLSRKKEEYVLSYAIKDYPEEAYFWYRMGKCHEALNQYCLALDDYTQAIHLKEIDTTFTLLDEAFYRRGFIKHCLKDSLGAELDRQEALKIKDNHHIQYYYTIDIKCD